MRRCRLLGVMGRRFGDDSPTNARSCRHGCPRHGRGGTCTWLFVRSARRLDNEGFWWRPSWKALRDGRRPPTNTSSKPGEWTHGWQYWASSISDTFFRKSSLLSSRAAASQHTRSHSSCNAGAALAHAPTTKEYTIPPQLFRVLLLERLQLPLPVTEVTCEGCHSVLDARGRHRAACTLSGRVKKRATPMERVLARVCREASARVRFDAYLRDMNVDVAASDGRRIEVFFFARKEREKSRHSPTTNKTVNPSRMPRLTDHLMHRRGRTIGATRDETLRTLSQLYKPTISAIV